MELSLPHRIQLHAALLLSRKHIFPVIYLESEQVKLFRLLLYFILLLEYNFFFVRSYNL
jgi:hypothetical protein